MSLESTRCVVLNASYEPISVISSKRALILVLEEKASVVEEHPELVVRSPSRTYSVPLSIVLKQYVRGRIAFRTKAVLTQRNLFSRDSQTCQYCGRHKSELRKAEKLTRDHILPRDLGGKDEWENVVAACNTCNNKKANYRLEDTTFVLRKEPKAPTLVEIWGKQSQQRATQFT